MEKGQMTVSQAKAHLGLSASAPKLTREQVEKILKTDLDAIYGLVTICRTDDEMFKAMADVMMARLQRVAAAEASEGKERENI